MEKKKHFDVKDSSNHLLKTLSIVVQMKPKSIKHVHLGRCTKCKKTGSRKLVTWIKHLGHFISYHEENLARTGIAEEQPNNLSTAGFVPKPEFVNL